MFLFKRANVMQQAADNINLKYIGENSTAYFFYIAQQNSQPIYFKIYGWMLLICSTGKHTEYAYAFKYPYFQTHCCHYEVLKCF